MRKHLAGIAAAVAALVLSLSALAGCSSVAERNGSNQTAVVLEGEKYSLDEAKLYIYASQYLVESSSEFMISYMYQSYEDFWDAEENGRTYYELNYVEGVNKLLQTKRLLKKAASDGITLSAEDLAKVDIAFDKFKEDEANVVEASGCSDELLKQFLTENALAVRVMMSMIADVDTNFDEAEFTRKNVEGLFVGAIQEKPSETSAEETEAADETAETEAAEKYTAEEQKAHREEAAAAIQEKLMAGEEISDIVNDFAESTTVRVTQTGTMTISPSDAAAEGEEPTTYRALAWTMKTGEIKVFEDSVSASNPTSCVLRCVSDDDPELRKTAEETELTNRKTALFAERYQELQERYSRYHVYENVIATVKKVIPMYKSEVLNAAETESAAE